MVAAKKKSKTTSSKTPIVGYIGPSVSVSNSSFISIPMSRTGTGSSEITYYTVPEKRKATILGIYKTRDNFLTDFVNSGVVFRTKDAVLLYRLQPRDDDTGGSSEIGNNIFQGNRFELTAGQTIGMGYTTTDASGRLAFTVVILEEDTGVNTILPSTQ